VFLPAAGQMTSTYVDYVTTTTVTEAATYWTSTPSGDKSDMNAFVLSIDDAGATVETDLMRRVMTAVRLVKVASAADLIKGDVNGDGSLSITDVTMTISHILGQTPEGFNAAVADVNGDGSVTITDVTIMIDMILKQE